MIKLKENKKIVFLSLALFLTGVTMYIHLEKSPPDDFFFHARIGEWIVKNKQIPQLGIYSWYAIENGITYTYHEWLSEIIDYFFDTLFNFKFSIYIKTIATMSFLLSFLYISIGKYVLRKSGFSITWILFGFMSIGAVSSARPHMYGLIFFAILIYCLEDIKENEDSKKFLVMPFLTVLWANLHGGSVVISYGMCFLYTAIAFFANWKGGLINSIPVVSFSKKRIKKFFGCGAACFLASCINPYGFNLFIYTVTHFGGNSDRKWILEWQAPTITSSPYTFVLISVLIYLIYKSNKKIEFSDFVILIIFAVLALLMNRFIGWLYIVANFIVFRYVEDDREPLKRKNHFFAYGILGLLLIIYSIINLSVKGLTPIYWLEEDVYDTLREADFKRLYCPNYLGLFLIYEGMDAFLDIRGEMYAPYNLDEGMYFSDGETSKVDLEEFMEKYDFDGYIVGNTTNINYYLSRNSNLACIYTDDLVSIYKTID